MDLHLEPTMSTQKESKMTPSFNPRILIVEDDVTMEALWRYIIDVAAPGSKFEWATTGEVADHLLRDGEKKGREFDLVITDIFLGGARNGIELWESHAQSTTHFLLMSVLTPQRLAVMATPRKAPLPAYLQKPLDPSQCIETIRALLLTAS